MQSDKTTKNAEFCVDFLLPKWYPNQALNESDTEKQNIWQDYWPGGKKVLDKVV